MSNHRFSTNTYKQYQTKELHYGKNTMKQSFIHNNNVCIYNLFKKQKLATDLILCR